MGRRSPGAGETSVAGGTAGVGAGVAGRTETAGKVVVGASEGTSAAAAARYSLVCDSISGGGEAGGAGADPLAGAGAGGAAVTDGQGVRGVGHSGGSDAPSAGVGRDGLDGMKGPAAVGFCAGIAGPALNATPTGSAGVIRVAGPGAVMPTGITPLQVEQRARTPPVGTFAGSTR